MMIKQHVTTVKHTHTQICENDTAPLKMSWPNMPSLVKSKEVLNADTVLILPSSLFSISRVHACVEVLVNLLGGETHRQTGERQAKT